MSELVTIENEKFIVKLLTLGATLNSFYVKSCDTDIVLGFDDFDKYLAKGNASIGKSVGRCANRIGNAKFTLDGKEYTLLANNGPNCLHGGEVRFGDKEWKIKEKTDIRVVFNYDSPDMESGFPGNLHVEAIYELNANELKLTYTGVSDKTTIFNMTNHSYFNFDKEKNNILNHELKIPAEKVNLNDENGMATDKTTKVDGTAFDFRSFRKVGELVSDTGTGLNEYCKKILNGVDVKNELVDNIDTNYIYENLDEKVLGILKNDKIELTLKSNLPDVQVYTGKALNVSGRGGYYGMYAGIALEPQFCPNAINYSDFLKPVILPNEKAEYVIKYIISEV